MEVSAPLAGPGMVRCRWSATGYYYRPVRLSGELPTRKPCMPWSDLGISLRNLGRNRNRAAVAVLTVAAGVMAFLLAGGFIAWIFQDMREATIHSQLGHAQIVRPAFFEKGLANPYGFLLSTASAELAKVESIPGVVTVSPRLIVSGLVSRGDTTVSFAGEGIDPERERSISRRVRIIAGSDLAEAGERGILLGEGLARSLDANVGETLVLLATTAGGSPSAVEARVAGIFATMSKEYDDAAIRLPIATARKLMRTEGSTSWVVLLDSTERTSQFVSDARTTLAATDYEVVPWTELADFYNKTVTLFSRQVTVVKAIIALIIVLTIANTLTMSVLERTTEIGTHLAIGVRRVDVMRLFIFEGVLVGALGGMIGLALGYAAAAAISSIGIPMPPPPGMAHGYIGQIIVTSDLAVDASILSIATTLVASIVPAWRAGRMNIVDALRYNQ